MLMFPRPMFDQDPDPGGGDPSPAPDPKKQQAGDSPPTPSPKGEDWEARYQGLQKVLAKKDATIVDLQAKLDKLMADFEELRSTSATFEKDKTALETQTKTVQDQLTTLTSERDTLKRQLAQQQLLIQKFPQLAHLAKYIPPADDDATFEVNAKAFADDLALAITAGVKDTLTGSSPPASHGTGEPVTEDEEEALYRKVTSLAGRPGKEEEYEATYKQWLTLKKVET